jgi:hypothetical protein
MGQYIVYDFENLNFSKIPFRAYRLCRSVVYIQVHLDNVFCSQCPKLRPAITCHVFPA